MVPAERRALDALLTLAGATRAYNAVIERSDWSPASREYIDAADALDVAEIDVLEAAELLLEVSILTHR